MTLQIKIETKLIEALKTKDKKTYSTLRLVVAAIKDTMIAKKIRDKQTLPDNELILLLKTIIYCRINFLLIIPRSVCISKKYIVFEYSSKLIKLLYLPT